MGSGVASEVVVQCRFCDMLQGICRGTEHAGVVLRTWHMDSWSTLVDRGANGREGCNNLRSVRTCTLVRRYLHMIVCIL